MTTKQAAKHCNMNYLTFKRLSKTKNGPKFAVIPYTRPSKKFIIDTDGNTSIEETTVNFGSFTPQFNEKDLDSWLSKRKKTALKTDPLLVVTFADPGAPS